MQANPLLAASPLFSANPIQIALTIGAVAIFMVLRLRRARRPRPLRVEQLWIVPALIIVVAVLVLWQLPPALADIPWLIGAAIVGGLIGWYRGKMMRITVDPDTHAVNQSASPWTMIFLLVLLALRYGARYALAEEAETWHIGIGAITDAPLLLAAAMLIFTRVEMYLRGQRLLNQARAAKPPQADAP